MVSNCLRLLIFLCALLTQQSNAMIFSANSTERTRQKKAKKSTRNLSDEGEQKDLNSGGFQRQTRELVIVKTPVKCSNPQHFSIHDKVPGSKPGYESSEMTVQSSHGGFQDFSFGQIWGKKYSHFLSSINSESRIFAFAANTSCHYTSLQNTMAGLMLGVKTPEIYVESQGSLELPAGGKKNHFDSLNNYALYHGFYPVAIQRDCSDHFFQLRSCKRLHKTMEHGSFLAMREYSDESQIKSALWKIWTRNKILENLFSLEYFEDFKNLEKIYEEVELRGLLRVLVEQDQKTFLLLYHLTMYAKYFSDGVSISSIMRPFVNKLLNKLKKYDVQPSTKMVRHKQRLLMFCSSKKIMIGLLHLIFDRNHVTAFDDLKNHLFKESYSQNQKMADQKLSDIDYVVEDGSNLVLEIFKIPISPESQKSQNQLLIGNSANVEKKKGGKSVPIQTQIYAVRGLMDGVKFNPCGVKNTETCSMEAFVNALQFKLGQFRPDSCEKPEIDFNQESLASFLDFTAVILLAICVWIATKLWKSQNTKILGPEIPKELSIICVDNSPTEDYQVYERIDAQKKGEKINQFQDV